ncbi:hypothetical protein CMV_017699 [Castanea mollissima]|uniref:phosphogluconate dehydrogenase (NADP(+)-dependent, decarboxylating) n=1 Tax=Castanea mollissima TaxID=60419 RepID=A0A8J4QSC4_9ROSI|nr:hypothetical protein CMV_017699 [Castanea mollissima]
MQPQGPLSASAAYLPICLLQSRRNSVISNLIPLLSPRNLQPSVHSPSLKGFVGFVYLIMGFRGAWMMVPMRARLPANLVQAQRDLFGAHTYERIDRPGSFHTEWTKLARKSENAGVVALN